MKHRIYGYLLLLLCLVGITASLPGQCQQADIAKYVQQLKDPDAGQRAQAVDALLDIARTHTESRNAAVQALLGSGDLRVLLQAQAIVTQQEPGLFKQAYTSFDRAIATALRKKDPRLRELALQALTDPNEVIRGWVPAMLRGADDPQAKEALFKLLADPAPNVRYSAAATLCHIPGEDVTDRLLPLLKDAESQVRRNVVFSLCWVRKEPRSVPAVLALATDADARVRQNMAMVIRRFDDPRVVDTLLILVKDADSGVRRSAIFSLGSFPNDPRAVNALLELVHGRDIRQRYTVVSALKGMTGQVTVRDALLALLQDDNLRVLAMTVLVETHDPRIPPKLKEMLLAVKGDEVGDILTLIGMTRDPQYIEPVLGKSGTVTRAEIRQQYASCVGLLLHEGKPPANTDSLLRALEDPNVGIRKTAIQTLLINWAEPWSSSALAQLWLGGAIPPIALFVPTTMPRDRLTTPGVVEPLLRCLQEPDAELVALAARAIGRTGDPRAFQPLSILLKSENKEVRGAALEGLSELGDSRALAPLLAASRGADAEMAESIQGALTMLHDVRDPSPLLALLRDPDWQVRSRAAAVLGVLGEERAVEPLIQLLRTNKDDNGGNRECAALALGLLGDDRAVEPLITTLHDPAEWVRSAAAWALGRLGDTRAIPPLVAALNPNDSRFQVRVASALIELGDERGWAPLLEAMNSKDDMTRSIGSMTLLAHPDPRAIDAIVAVANDEKNKHRYQVVTALANIKDPHIFDIMDSLNYSELQQPALRDMLLLRQGDIEEWDYMNEQFAKDLETLHGFPESVTVSDLLIRLPTLDEAQFTEPLAKLMSSDSPWTQVLAARALALRKDARGIPPLLDAVRNPRNPFCYAAAIKALAEIDPQLVRGKADAETTTAIVKTLTGGSIEDCVQVAEVAGILRISGAYNPLMAMLRSDSSRLREASARGLGKLGDKRAVPSLIATLRDPSSRVRLQAVIALGEMGDAVAIDPLIAVLETEQGSRLRAAAAGALKAITGQDFGEDAGGWRAWRGRK